MKMSLSKLIVAAACVLCVLVVVLAPAEAVSAQEALPTGGLESSLMPGLGIGGGQQAAEEAEARLSTPEALAEDARSRMAFAGDKRDAAVALAKQVFGIEHPHWTPPQDQGSGRITKYAGSKLAEELLPDGAHVLVASSLPLRSSIGSGEEKPVSLELSSTGSGYAPANPLVPVVLGKTPGEGVSFPLGLRMAPVAQATPEAAEVVGDSVFYPGTAKDTDFMLEPRPLGVEASWQLLSAESPSENALSFSLPPGAQLTMSKTVEGAAEVALEGEALLLIMPATATAANGAHLPVSYSVSGSTLTTHVNLSGNVDFPVYVDPVVWQKYGGGSGFWTGWTTAASQPGVAKFFGGSGNSGIGAEIDAEAPGGSWANWSLFAPGFKAGEGSLTRMDVTNMMHLAEEKKSNVEAGIVGAENKLMPDPSYTYDGEIPGDTRKGMMLTSEKFEGRPVAFCAQEEEGGYDGGSKPLCNEKVGGEYFRFTIDTWERQRYYQWEEIEANTARFIDTSKIEAKPSAAAEIDGTTNVLAGSEKWFGPNNGALEIIGSDPAFGVSQLKVTIEGGGKSSSVTREYAKEGYCSGILCYPEEKQMLTYSSFPAGIPNGVDKITIEASDASGLTAIWSSSVDVDAEAPSKPTVSGSDVHEKEVNITEGPAGDQITVEARDGEGSVPSSGIKHMGIWIDGVQHEGYEGSCARGMCTAKATWTLNGRELGAGSHKLTVKALDNADNESTSEYELEVHAAQPLAMGPGSVNPQSGDFALESADVDLKDSSGALMVTQHYDSRNVTEGAEGPLGPQWTIGLGQLATLEVLGEKNEKIEKLEDVMVAGPEGLSLFKGTHDSFTSAENPELTLTLASNEKEFILENKKTGNSTIFTHPKGAKHWMPTVSKASGKTDTLTDSYQSIEVEKGRYVVEPTEELAPHGEAKCPAEREALKADEETQARACRALFFYYGGEKATQSEASGEKESQWGWYPNQLSRVVAVMWSTSAGKMEETAVAEFSYDKKGRLRAEWDPRIEKSTSCGGSCSALKTIYGYDEEGHVTSLTPPGEQPWIFTYGTTAEDGSSGRLLKARRAMPAKGASKEEVEKLLSEERTPPENSESIAISGTQAVGVQLSVSNGKWTGKPISYAYQWSRCNASFESCEVIPGATNQNYTPVTADVNHILKAQVTAININGAVAVATKSGPLVASKAIAYVSHSENIDSSSISAVSCIPASTDCVVGDSKGNALYATNVSSKAAATWSSWSGPGVSPSEAVDCPASGLCLLAAGSSDEGAGNLYYATSLGGVWSEAYSPAYGVDAIACVSSSLCIDGQDGGGYLRSSTKPASTSWTLTSQGSAKMTAASCSSILCVLADSTGKVHVAASTSKIESGTWTETDVDGSTALTGVACLTGTTCLAVDGTGNALQLTINTETGAVSSTKKTDIDGSTALTAISCYGSVCVAVDSKGNLFVTLSGGNSWSKTELGGDLTSVSCATEKLCLTASTSGQITAFNPKEEAIIEGEHDSPQSGATIEYDVPVSGSNAPYAMSHGEVEKWGQKDYPAEAAEIFPEEHSQGWPASGHTGAIVYYTDDEAQPVNVISPSNGVATTEYHEGAVVRALSAANRERALKEAKPVEAAEKLATISKYSEENNDLTEVTGPEHKVKLSNGEEVNARNNVRYFYDEGAPENAKDEAEEYGLVTKTTDGALLANSEEKDVRTTLTGYSGQEGLGWTLHAPTSTTAEPQGANLIASTKYNKETGAIEETRTPGGNTETVSPPEPKLRFGSLGSGNGQFDEPAAVAVGTEGDIYVADQENDRIEKFTSSGGFVESFTPMNGSAKRLDNPNGIAISPKSGDIYIADTGKGSVVVLNSKGEFLTEWTEVKREKAPGEFITHHFASPVGIAVNSGGHVFVSNNESDEIYEIAESGTLESEFGGKGTEGGKLEHAGLLAFANGVLYAVDQGNKRVEEFSPTGSYFGQFGSAGSSPGEFKKPWGIAAAPVTGDLYVTDEEGDTVSQFSPAGKYLGQVGWWGNGEIEFEGPEGLAVSSTGSVYVADMYNNRISVWQEPEAGGAHVAYSTQFGTAGTGEGEFEYPAVPAVSSGGKVWVTDYGSDKVDEFTSQGKFIASFGSEGAGNGQYNRPTGIAINQASNNVYVGDCYNHRIQELNAKGEFIRAFTSTPLNCPGAIAIDGSGNVWTVDMAADEVEEFSSTGTFLHAYGSKGKGNLQFEDPVGIAVVGSTVYVADEKNDRIEEISTSGEYIGQFGKEGPNGGEFYGPEGIAANSAGDLFALDTYNDRIEEFSPSGHYLETISENGSGEGQLKDPQGLTITAAGDIYVADAANHRVEKWAPITQAVHDTKTIYYSPGTEAGVAECENKPQWAGMVCQTEPLAQPTDSAAEPKGEELPRLPVVRIEYNMWLQPVKSIETIGNKTRTKTTTYEGERMVGQTVEAGADRAVQPVHDKYSSTLGVLVEQSQESEHEGTKTIGQTFNTLGQPESYTDAEGNATTYSYDQYGRPTEVNYDASKLDHLADRELLHYEETTGQLAEIEDLGGEGTYKEVGTGPYKATYGPEGELATETYPNNMTATYGYNSVGEGTSLTYTKNNHCTGSECEWFTDTLTPSVHGEAMVQKSSLSTEQYRYEQPDLLAEVKETPVGEDCTARIYAQNEEGARTSLITRKSGSSECTATEGGTIERHTFDEANRNTDEGVQYEPLGNITKIPAADAGGHELTTEYYANGQVLSQTQGETTNNYLLDPEGRTRQTETIIKLAASVTVAHYAGAGGTAPSWTYNQTGGTITRNVAAFGGLAAVEEAGKEALLQIRDLQGNVVGTASLSEAAGKPHTLERTTEYGVPTKEKPEDKYNWLGTVGITSNLSSGTIVQDGATYVPQLGAPLQAEGVPIPAPPLTAVPYVVTASPTWYASSEPPAAPGSLVDPECYVKVAVGPTISSTGKEWVYARGWGWCHDHLLPAKAWLKVCLGIETELGIGEIFCTQVNLDGKVPKGHGEATQHQLYAHEHTYCESGFTYSAWAWFWAPGFTKTLSTGEGGFVCKGTPLEKGIEIAQSIIEVLPEYWGKGTPEG